MCLEVSQLFCPKSPHVYMFDLVICHIGGLWAPLQNCFVVLHPSVLSEEVRTSGWTSKRTWQGTAQRVDNLRFWREDIYLKGHQGGLLRVLNKWIQELSEVTTASMFAHIISPWWHCICWYPPSSSQLGTNTGIPDSAPAARARCFSSAHLAPPKDEKLFICHENVAIKLSFKYLLPSWTRQGPRYLNFTLVPLHIADWSPHLGNVFNLIWWVDSGHLPWFISDIISSTHKTLFYTWAVHLTKYILEVKSHNDKNKKSAFSLALMCPSIYDARGRRVRPT